MKTVKELIDDGITKISLNILVFGPQVSPLALDLRTQALQKKRIEIRDCLTTAGHSAKFAEELVDPGLPGPHGNICLQEMLIMQEYDVIVTLVESPGSVAEATIISQNPKLSRKALLFMDRSFQGGFAASACALAELQGANFSLYDHPKDLDECHLLTKVVDTVKKIQLINFLS